MEAQSEYDVFICHASEDKAEIAFPLAQELKNRGKAVWYDEFTLTLGDSISEKIDEGLANSRYGVVILSPTFFKKYWTKTEFGGLRNLESKGNKFILPILHDMTIQELSRYSPTLCDKCAISSEKGIKTIADAIEQVLTGNKENIVTGESGKTPPKRTTFLPELSLSEITDKLTGSSQHNLRSLGDQVKKFLTISTGDIEMAIVKADLIVKQILREVYLMQNYNAEIPSYFEFLNSNHLLGSIVAKHCAVIDSFRKVVIYDDDELEKRSSDTLSKNELDLCKQSFKIILNWYLNAYEHLSYTCDKLSIVEPENFTLGDVAELYRIETKLFPLELITPLEIAINWHKHNPKALVGVRDSTSGKLAGFINALPITDSLFKRIESGDYIDTHIPLEEIRLYDLPDFYKMYFCSFCVDPAYKNTTAFKLVIDGFIDLLLKLAVENEIYITEIIADAITKKGEELCEFAGMKELKVSSHGSKIYKAVLLPPSLRLKYKNGRRLTAFYQRVYEDYRELL